MIKAWGFTYRSMLTWGKSRLGLGVYIRNSSETILFATRGHAPVKFHGQPSWLFAPVQEHSHKPEEQFAIIERLSTGRIWNCLPDAVSPAGTSGATRSTAISSSLATRCRATAPRCRTAAKLLRRRLGRSRRRERDAVWSQDAVARQTAGGRRDYCSQRFPYQAGDRLSRRCLGRTGASRQLSASESPDTASIKYWQDTHL